MISMYKKNMYRFCNAWSAWSALLERFSLSKNVLILDAAMDEMAREEYLRRSTWWNDVAREPWERFFEKDKSDTYNFGL